MTPLAHKLVHHIEEFGPITIADYMAACLGDPVHGYYMTRDPFGPDGDFVTAPEVSQMFGELIGVFTVETWRRMGRPRPFVLTEFGPGRGTLMADLLRAARIDDGFEASASIHLVETSPLLRKKQQQTLASHSIHWHVSIETLPPGPAIIIANEFFDALPIRQYLKTDKGWAERMVGLDGDRLAFGFRPDAAFDGADERLAAGSMVEVAEPAARIVATLSARLARFGGALLAIDYGAAEGGSGDTLQAVRAHRFDNPLAHPGEADLTVHVDFGSLAKAAHAHEAVSHPPLDQGDFLLALGLVERAGRLGAGKTAEIQDTIRAAVERLAGPDGMGSLFKVLTVTSAGLVPPPFDQLQNLQPGNTPS